MNPRAPKGHRLTVEPIPDMGPRARQTARYQAPESRLNWATFHRLFSLLESAPEDANPRKSVCETPTKIALGGWKHEMFLEKINESGDGSEPANNP